MKARLITFLSGMEASLLCLAR